MTNDFLNKKLKKWAAQVPSKKDQMDPFLSEKIMSQIRHREILKEDVTQTSYRWIWTRLTLSFCILLLMGGIFYSFQQKERLAKNNLILKPEELKEIHVAADTIEQIFPEGVLLISQSEGEIDIKSGQSNAAEDISAKSRILIVYHILETDARGLKIVKRHDLILRVGEPVDMLNGQKITLWTHQVDETHINIETDNIIKDNSFQIRVQDNYIQTYGVQNLIAKQKFEEKFYEVYQTVYRL